VPPQPEPEPGVAQVEYQHLICEANGLALTAMPKPDGKCEWGCSMSLQPREEGNPRQRWRLHADPGAYLECEISRQILDIDGGNVAAGASLVLWGRKDRPNQKWSHLGEGYIASKLNGMVVTAMKPEQGPGCELKMWTKEGEDRQKWRFAP
jgi:hypothetical protein